MTNEENYPVWRGEILETLETEPFQNGKPIPYIADLSETGLLTIGWDTKLKVNNSNSNEIEETLLAVRQ